MVSRLFVSLVEIMRKILIYFASTVFYSFASSKYRYIKGPIACNFMDVNNIDRWAPNTVFEDVPDIQPWC